MTLGLRGLSYEVTGDFAACAAFVDACSSAQAGWARAEAIEDITELGVAIDALVAGVGDRVPRIVPARQTDGYLRRALVRKILVAVLACRDAQPDWEGVPAPSLKAFGPDLGGFLDDLPADISAAQVGRLFFDRDDWCLFLGLFACLWRPPAKQYEQSALLALVRGEAFLERARALAAAAGHGVSPASVLDHLGLL